MTNLHLLELGVLLSTFSCSSSGIVDAPGTAGQTLAFAPPSILSDCIADVTESADFNGDGLRDLQARCSGASPGGGGVAIYVNQGDGSFGDPDKVDVDDAYAFDVNGDGRDDLVTGTKVFLANKDGSFGSSVSATWPSVANTQCDFDGDGRKDLLSFSPAGTATAYSVGSDGSTSVVFQVTGIASWPRCADVDHDGNVDLLWAEGFSVRSRLNQGGGRLDVSMPLVTSDTNLTIDAVDDFDADGFADLVISPASGGDYALFHNTNGSFTQSASLVNGGPIHTYFMDVTGDRKMDVMLADSMGNVGVLPGRGDATFEDPTLLTGPWTAARAIIVAPFTPSNKIDLVITDGSSASVLLRR